MANPRAQQLRPVYISRALIRRRVAPGDPLFSDFNRRNFNGSFKAAMAQLRVPEAHRYSSHGFRRWTTQELNETGPPWSAVATSGEWHSSAVRGYVDMSRDVELVVHQLFEVDMDSTSGQEN